MTLLKYSELVTQPIADKGQRSVCECTVPDTPDQPDPLHREEQVRVE
ncbi:unnamed protein product [Plutella xylostella]|uniref:(diamondback moth) hypothetical protein n=1 Tax=Plutella xylostella TaxID=51655 RepID=A0A8S4DHW8_PLUXY|nr:unnamed protein product [Plutella xylostella]